MMSMSIDDNGDEGDDDDADTDEDSDDYDDDDDVKYNGDDCAESDSE